MPCNYKDYHPKWTLIVRLIKKREGNCCKFCGVANGFIGRRTKYGIRPLSRDGIETDMIKQKQRNGYSYAGALKALRFTKIVLTVAHLDHNKHNNRFYNLAALCQRCHLRHDIKQHTANRKYGRSHNSPNQLTLL
jgi:hypothetical protein